MPLVPLIGVLYVIVGVAGFGVLLFSEPLRDNILLGLPESAKTFILIPLSSG